MPDCPLRPSHVFVYIAVAVFVYAFICVFICILRNTIYIRPVCVQCIPEQITY